MAGLAVLAFAGVWVLSGSPPTPGVQVESPAMDIGGAGPVGWLALETGTPVRGADFPQPMARVDDRETCIGFSRVDFSATNRRPTLERCVARTGGGLGTREIRVLMIISSGTDTWLFVEAADPVVAVDAEVLDDGPLDTGRILVGGPVFALLLATDTDLSSLRWETTDGTFTCSPAADTWSTGVLCS